MVDFTFIESLSVRELIALHRAIYLLLGLKIQEALKRGDWKALASTHKEGGERL